MNEEYASNQSRLAWILGGVSLGAIAMYLADPDRGRQRRAYARDTVRSAMSSTGEALNVARHDIGSRMQDWRAQASNLMSRRTEQLDDVILKQRVRQQIEHAVSNPQAIEIDAQQGGVTLRGGPVRSYERQNLLDTVRRVDGVTRVDDYLDVRDQSAGYSSFQPRQAETHWRRSAGIEKLSPTVSAIAMLAGGAFGLYWLMTQRGEPTGMRGRAITVNKSIYIDARPERVYDIWSTYENFPRFMSNVQEVRDLGGGRSHWIVRGPAGAHVEWDAHLTESRRGELLAWQSEPGSSVENRGWVRFDPEGNGTRVSVHMSYTPPAGTVGHALASLFGTDPKQQMDEDLMRMKTFVETGQAPRDAAQPAQTSASTLH